MKWFFSISIGLALLLCGDFSLGYLNFLRKQRELAQSSGFEEHPLRCQDVNFHHGLRVSVTKPDSWGGKSYEVTTNSLGFKDRIKREVPKTFKGRRLLFMGDSFTEGIGYPFEKSFVGLIAKSLTKTEVLNGATVSYSPKLHYLKVRQLLQAGYQFDELHLFIDSSDPIDEIRYSSFKPENASLLPSPHPSHFERTENRYVIHEYSLIYRTIMKKIFRRDPWRKITYHDPVSQHRFVFHDERIRWLFDNKSQRDWGNPGLEICAHYARELVELMKTHGIKTTIYVYPWPEEIRKFKSSSANESYWREFCRKHDVPFHSFYPDFLTGDREETIAKLFIPGDCHWNLRGHEKIFKSWLKHRNQSP